MIFKDTLKSYSNTPQSRMYFTDSDIDTDIIVNTKHIKSLKASSTSPYGSIELYLNRFSSREPFLKFDTSNIETVRAGFDLTQGSDKFSFQYYPNLDTDNDIVLQEVHLEHLVLAKYYNATTSYIYVLSGGLVEKFLVDGTVAEIYASL